MKVSWLSLIPLMSSKASVLGLESRLSYKAQQLSCHRCHRTALSFKDGERPGFRQTTARYPSPALVPRCHGTRGNRRSRTCFLFVLGSGFVLKSGLSGSLGARLFGDLCAGDLTTTCSNSSTTSRRSGMSPRSSVAWSAINGVTRARAASTIPIGTWAWLDFNERPQLELDICY